MKEINGIISKNRRTIIKKILWKGTLDMSVSSSSIFDNKMIIKLKNRVCDTSEELLFSDLFEKVLTMSIKNLSKRNSRVLDIFEKKFDGARLPT